jgi:hypothetical protein
MSTAVHLAAFSPFWGRVCERYNREIFDPQCDLWPPLAMEEAFSQFVYWRLWPLMASENECVRNILRVAGSLPSRSSTQAAQALVMYMDELTFNVDMQPRNPGYFE